MFRRTSARRSPLGAPAPLLAGLTLILTLGVGMVEAGHGEEHADESQCIDCLFCLHGAQNVEPSPPRAPMGADPVRVADLQETAESIVVVPTRRRDAARAPPA